MKKFFIVMFLFFTVSAFADSYTARFTWNSPTENVDGTPLTDLAGFRLYGGQQSGVYSTWVDTGNVEEYTWALDVPEGSTWYFVVTAFDTSGNESEDSNEVSVPFGANPPASPTGLGVELQ